MVERVATDAPDGATDLWARLSAAAPFAILAYCVALLALRLSLSPFLEVDEAEFVGHVDLALVYANSHPPLYHWLARGALELTGWNWPLALGLVKYGLLAAFHLFTWDSARRLGGPRAGLAALAVSAFLPQVVWMSAVTMAHSVAVLGAAAMMLWALARTLRAPTAWNYALLGLAAGLGALSKFNFWLILIPSLVALAVDQSYRRQLFRPVMGVSAAVFAVVAGPSMVAALADLETSASRIGKLYRGGDLAWIDPPILGVDGVVTLIVAALAWAAPALVIWAAAQALEPPRNGAAIVAAADSAAAHFGRLLGRAMLLGLGLFALIVLAADMHKVEERYLTPILAALPVYLALRWPLETRLAPVALLAAAFYCAVFPAFWGMARFGGHRYDMAYDVAAATLAGQVDAPLPILAARHDDAANFTLALGWPGAAEPSYPPLGDRALLLWRGVGSAPARLAPDGFAPVGEIGEATAWWRSRQGGAQGGVTYRFQVLRRITSE